MPRRINLNVAGQYYAALGPKVLEAARRGLVKSAEQGVQKIVTQIIPSRSPQPVDRGVFRAGWKTDRADLNTVLILNPELHAIFIEDGVRASNVKIGAPMIRALSEWALRKGIAHDSAGATQVAWAVARAAQRRGIFNRNSGPGLGILKELVEQHLDTMIQQNIANEVGRAMRGGGEEA